MTEPTEQILRVTTKCQDALTELADLFLPHMKFTLVVRSELDQEEDLVISEDDELDKVCRTVYRMYQQNCPHTSIIDTNPAFCSNCGLEIS